GAARGMGRAVAFGAPGKGGGLLAGGKPGSEREGAHDTANAGGEIPPRDMCVHQILPVAWLALSTARMMRPWVPQRHRLSASPSRTCASVGGGVLWSSGVAELIMPWMQ